MKKQEVICGLYRNNPRKWYVSMFFVAVWDNGDCEQQCHVAIIYISHNILLLSAVQMMFPNSNKFALGKNLFTYVNLVGRIACIQVTLTKLPFH